MNSWLKLNEVTRTKVKLSSSGHLSQIANKITHPFETKESIVSPRYTIHSTEM